MEQVDAIKQYIALSKRKAKLETELREVKSAMSTIEEQALDYMTQAGMQNVRMDDRTVYIGRHLYASFRGTDEALRALEEMGYIDALKTTVNSNTARGLVREFLEIEDTEERRALIDKAFNVREVFKLGITK